MSRAVPKVLVLPSVLLLSAALLVILRAIFVVPWDTDTSKTGTENEDKIEDGEDWCSANPCSINRTVSVVASTSLLHSNNARLCVNRKIIIESPAVPSEGSIVLVEMDDNNLDIGWVEIFEESSSERELIDFLDHIPDGFIVVVISVGHVGHKLTQPVLSALQHFGANLHRRPPCGLIMVGRRGMRPGSAIQKIIHALDQSGSAELKLCLTVPGASS